MISNKSFPKTVYISFNKRFKFIVIVETNRKTLVKILKHPIYKNYSKIFKFSIDY